MKGNRDLHCEYKDGAITPERSAGPTAKSRASPFGTPFYTAALDLLGGEDLHLSTVVQTCNKLYSFAHFRCLLLLCLKRNVAYNVREADENHSPSQSFPLSFFVARMARDGAGQRESQTAPATSPAAQVLVVGGLGQTFRAVFNPGRSLGCLHLVPALPSPAGLGTGAPGWRVEHGPAAIQSWAQLEPVLIFTPAFYKGEVKPIFDSLKN
jgi:hypothetical protein